MFILSAQEGKPRAYRECNTEDTRRVILNTQLNSNEQTVLFISKKGNPSGAIS